jgi:hypothetical protein
MSDKQREILVTEDPPENARYRPNYKPEVTKVMINDQLEFSDNITSFIQNNGNLLHLDLSNMNL